MCDFVGCSNLELWGSVLGVAIIHLIVGLILLGFRYLVKWALKVL
jgi:hypothetical protein